LWGSGWGGVCSRITVTDLRYEGSLLCSCFFGIPVVIIIYWECNGLLRVQGDGKIKHVGNDGKVVTLSVRGCSHDTRMSFIPE